MSTCDRIMVLAFCNYSDDILSIYQVPCNSLLYFQKYAPDKHFIAKIRKGSNSVNTDCRVWVLRSAILLMAFYQCIKFH